MKLLHSLAWLSCISGIPSLHAEAAAQSSQAAAQSSQAAARAIIAAKERISAALEPNPIDSPGRVVVVYFTPRDRKPAANHVDRTRRIVEEAARFYQQELARHGFNDRRMNVLRDDTGQVEIIDVVGKEKDYDKPDGDKVRKEAVAVLREKQIDPDRIVLLIFCNLMDYDPEAGKISHHSPYYGGGNRLTGTAWQCDSEILDPKRFRDPTPILDGEYGHITIGRHNSIFIGGVIHELGHALSLPHCRQREDEAVKGTALMGAGNRTYAQQLRGEGRGTFLTQAHALRLAAHPAFNRRVAGSLYDRPRTEWPELGVEALQEGRMLIRGQVSGSVPVHGVIAYFDPAGGGDYDATTATAVPDESGRFVIRSGKLRAGRSAELRLVACHVNGATTSRAMNYQVDGEGEPDLSKIRISLELTPMLDALRQSDLSAARQALKLISGDDESLKQIGQRVLDRFQERPEPASLDPGAIPASTDSIAISRLKPTSAKVGWIRPTYDRVPEAQRLLSIDGDYFSSGIYAHAPAEHTYQIDGGWKRLRGRCGLQSGHGGKVDFEVSGDGRTLWNSSGITVGPGASFDVDVTGVEKLVLKVSDGGDGAGADWGVWIEPMLSR